MIDQKLNIPAFHGPYVKVRVLKYITDGVAVFTVGDVIQVSNEDVTDFVNDNPEYFEVFTDDQ